MKQKNLPALDLNQRYTIDETSAYLRQCRARTYQQIQAGELPVIRDGRRVYVPGRAIAARSSLESASS